MDLILAGTETVTSTLRYSLLILLKYPHVAGKLGLEDKAICFDDSSPGN